MLLYRSVLVWCLRASAALIFVYSIYHAFGTYQMAGAQQDELGMLPTQLDMAASAILPAIIVVLPCLTFAEILALLNERSKIA